MKTFVAAISLLAVVLVAPASAAPKKHHPAPQLPEYRIVAADALSISVSVGKSGDEHETFAINDQTKVTLNGVAVASRDLRAGMEARIAAGADHVATSIAAKDAPAHPARHRVG